MATGQSPAGGRPVLSEAELKQYVVGVNGSDVVWNPMFDSLTYPSAGFTEWEFFNEGIGAGSTSAPGAGTGKKTLFDTNMRTQNQLSKGIQFYAIGSETIFQPGVQPTEGTPYAFFPVDLQATAADIGGFIKDMWAVLSGGLKELKVNTDRWYIQDTPLFLFPPSAWFHMHGAFGALTPTTQASVEAFELNYSTAAGEPYEIVPVYIQSNQEFTLSIKYAAAIATPSGFPGRMIERLRGYRIRQIT